MTGSTAGLPDRFVGAWQRVGLALEGGPEQETADVLWLQSPTWFADLRVERVTGEVTACFAGVTTWSAPSLTWSRHLDLGGVEHEDVGHVDWDGDDLIETGVFPFPGSGGPVPYLERWRRLSDDRPVRSWTAPGAIVLHAGIHSLGVVATSDGLAACRRQLTPRGWVVEHTLGRGAAVVPSASFQMAAR